ncbi:MAG: LuxR C-terminal-related transcriptional regulator [Pirellulaceae bacterium]
MSFQIDLTTSHHPLSEVATGSLGLSLIGPVGLHGEPHQAGKVRSHSVQCDIGNVDSARIFLVESPWLKRSCLPASAVDRVQHCDSLGSAVDVFANGLGGCVLIDFDTDREEIVEQLRETFLAWKLVSVIACSKTDSGQSAMEAAKAGCVEFVALDNHEHSSNKAHRVDDAIERACRFDTEGQESPQQFRENLKTLTTREDEVLRFFINGMNTKVIAKQQSVSYQTIDKHRNRALRKMNCGSLVEFASLLYRRSYQS